MNFDPTCNCSNRSSTPYYSSEYLFIYLTEAKNLLKIVTACTVSVQARLHAVTSFNNTLRVTGSKRKEMVVVHLIKSYCLPSLLYSCETWHARSDDIRSANIAWNNSFRKVFNSLWRESVEPLLMYCCCLPVSVLINQRRLLFWRKCASSDKPVLRTLALCCRDARQVLCVTCTE